LQRGVELLPSDASSHHSLAACLAALGRYEEAIAEDTLSIELCHTNPRVWFMERWQEAVKDLQMVSNCNLHVSQE
jgi:hypothetical protein